MGLNSYWNFNIGGFMSGIQRIGTYINSFYQNPFLWGSSDFSTPLYTDSIYNSYLIPRTSSFLYQNNRYFNYPSIFSNTNIYSGINFDYRNNTNFTTFPQKTLFNPLPKYNLTDSYHFTFSTGSETSTKQETAVKKKPSPGMAPKPTRVPTPNLTKGNIDNSYIHLSRDKALAKAENDDNLERLRGGQNWSVSEASFRTDIPYAKAGTNEILDEVAKIVKQKTGQDMIITSALGTAGTASAKTPHVNRPGVYQSHHNAENPKLDIVATGNQSELAEALRSTGYFSRVSAEPDHLDVQIDPSKFA